MRAGAGCGCGSTTATCGARSVTTPARRWGCASCCAGRCRLAPSYRRPWQNRSRYATKVSEMASAPLSDVFIEMADTLVDDFDLIDFLHTLTTRCVELLGVTAAGLMLTDAADRLQVVAASSEQTRLLALFQLQADEGPCVECSRTGKAVSVDYLPAVERWPRFSAMASNAGYAAVHALPMRLRSEVIGALNLFESEQGALDREKARFGQALADIATVGLLQQRAIQARDLLAEQ